MSGKNEKGGKIKDILRSNVDTWSERDL